ncbi:hypothetical protein NQ176_g9921 [Zarea fungicola]|uniref:Uncharacterized protein n=1 Tax=Zarea fungicola TaxID=93591 RepID=A0ACC1MJ80_9HYPO|nr:hypothetical protein NQ176_g9921 [Lecanicillium fungicola]
MDDQTSRSLQVIVLGSGGGPLESNVTAFLVRSIEQDWRKGSIIAVDAGVHLSAITRLIEEATPSPTPTPPFTLTSGPFAGLRLPHSTASANAAHVTRTLVDTYLITHPHLDHISGFVINTAGLPGTRPKKLAALPSTIQAFKTHIFNNVIWPNLSDENNGAGLLTYLRLTEGGNAALGDGESKGYLEVCDGLQIKTWSVSHGHCVEKHGHRGSSASNPSTRFGSHDASSFNHMLRRDTYGTPYMQPMSRTHSIANQNSFPSGLSPRQSMETERICVYDSSAYFIQEQSSRREILIFGDVEPDSVSLSPRNLHIWQEAAPKIASGLLSAIFIECSYDDSQSNDRLYGHLKPVFVIEELKALAAEVDVARKLRALESKKRKRLSVSEEGRERPRHARKSATAQEDPVSPKSLKPSQRTSDVTMKTDNGTETPHIATPTGQLSLDDADIGIMELPPAATPSMRPLRGLKIVIIHVKEKMQDGPPPGDVILEQLQEYEEEAQLGCEFVVSKSGQSFYF